MTIAILSDSHDHLDNLRRVLEAVQDTEALLHCGDLVSPFVIVLLGEQYKQPIHIVYGNNDGDHALIEERAKQFPHITLHGATGAMKLDGRTIAFVHEPELMSPYVAEGTYDLICYGHTHIPEQHWEGKTLIVNPGDVMGKDDAKAHYATYDTKDGTATLHALKANPP